MSATGLAVELGIWATVRSLRGGRAHRLQNRAGGADECLKHAVSARSVRISLSFAEPDVAVLVVDDGQCRPPPPPRAGEPAGRIKWGWPRDRGHGRAGGGFRRDPQCRPPSRRRLAGHRNVARLQGARPLVTIRVVLADDQGLLRKGFRMILEAEEDISVIGEAEDGAAAVRLVELYEPDVVLMDVRMPELDGIEATRAIAASGSLCNVLILTTFDLDEYAFSALRAGASGFLLKDVPPEELARAIRTVARGDAVVSPRITKRLLQEYAHQLPDLSSGAQEDGAVPAILGGLTGRELEVLVAVAEGLSNVEIAERLFVSEATVKSHVGRVLAKLGLRNRVQAVVLAFQTGLVRPS